MLRFFEYLFALAFITVVLPLLIIWLVVRYCCRGVPLLLATPALICLCLAPAHADAVLSAPAPVAVVVPAGSLIGQILNVLLLVIGTPLAGALVMLLAKLAQRAGVDITDAYRDRLEQIILNGLHGAAARAGVVLDGKLGIKLRQGIIADAALYVADHGADALKQLQADPADLAGIEAIIFGRFARWFGLAEAAQAGAPIPPARAT